MGTYNVPSIDDLEEKTIAELEALLKHWGPHYSNRDKLKLTDYMEIAKFYVCCSMVLENLNNGWKRWWRIKVPVTENRFD